MTHIARLLVGLGLTAAGCAAPDYAFRGRPAFAAVPGVRHADGTFEGAGGVRLFEQSWRPEGDARAALVVVHGLKDHSSRYAEAASALARRGIAVHAFDLRGHGFSDGARVWVDWFDDYVDDLARFVDRVRAAEPGRPVFVFGHSMGGAIVALYALRKPDVRGVVLSAPALKVTDDVSPILVAATGVLGALAPTLAVLDLPNANFSRDAKVVEAMGSDKLVYQGAGPARTARELLRAIGRIQDGMEAMEVPFLVLHGTADKLTNPQGSRDLAARARSKDKTLTIYEGAWHDLLHEPDKDRVLADVAAWIEARL